MTLNDIRLFPPNRRVPCSRCEEQRRFVEARFGYRRREAGPIPVGADVRTKSSNLNCNSFPQSKMENETEPAASLCKLRASSSRSFAFSLAGEIKRGVT